VILLHQIPIPTIIQPLSMSLQLMPIQNVRTCRDGKSTRDSDVRASYRSSNRKLHRVSSTSGVPFVNTMPRACCSKSR
jgi:hypothetical protein